MGLCTYQAACFAEPLFQTEFDNPANPEMPYRVDFCWKLHDGRIIVVEYDGIAKYRDTSNPNRANLMAKFEYERQRDANLKTQGVTSIKHLFYEDVSDLKRLNALLTAIGIPQKFGNKRQTHTVTTAPSIHLSGTTSHRRCSTMLRPRSDRNLGKERLRPKILSLSQSQ